MRFKTYLQKEPKHSDLVSCVSWHTTEEVLSCSDDHTVMAWNLVTNEATKLITLPDDLYPTDMQFYPRSSTYGGSKKHGAGDIFVVTATDGKFHLINRNGRIEKSMEAHRGAVLAAQWSHDGTALVTAGEDGHVKIWSRSGMLRSTLASNSLPIYSVAWNPNSNKVLFTFGRQLVIKPLQPHLKPVQWQAHDGLILKVSWNTNNNLIVSGSEDCKYKVWDSYGGVLYCSHTSDYPITSVAWAPNGEMFAVGSFNCLRLCDQTGWSYSLDKPQTQSIFCLAWSGDGTQIAGGCGNGHVIFAHVIEKRLEWKTYEATIRGRKTIAVQNVSTDVVENLDFRDSIIQASLEHNHMVVITSAQCFLYSIKNWNTPQVINLKEGNVTLVAQSERHFLLADGGGLYIYSYEGRLLSSPKWPAMRPAVLNHQTLSLCSDTLAVRDKQDERVVHMFDALTAKPAGDGKPLHHSAEVVEIALDNCGPPADRKLAFVDKNKELFLATVRSLPSNGIRVVKLGIVMQSIKWNDNSNMLAALQDGRLTIWYYPAIAYFNRQFLSHTIVINEISDFGNNPRIIHFLGTHISIRRVDGSLISTTVAPYPSLLHGYVSSSRWDDALRLCRFVKDDALWACLAAMSTMARELETAELAYAAIDEMDKVEYIQYIRNLPLKELQNSEVALLCGNFKEAESILLHSGHVFRAIMLNLRLYKWERALELATKHGKHIETVLAFRQKYLKALKKNKETNAQFLQLMKEVEVNFETVNASIEEEYQKERNVASSSQSRER